MRSTVVHENQQASAAALFGIDAGGETYTHFNDFEGGKASNTMVSTDGRFMAFQTARTTDPAGVGYGLLIYWFKK